MNDDIFPPLQLQSSSHELMSPLYKPNRSRKLNFRETQAINCLLDEDEKQDPEQSLTLLQEFQRNNNQQNKRKTIQRRTIKKNLSPIMNKTSYPKMIKNHSMKQQPRNHFDLSKRTNIPYLRDYQQQSTAQQLLDQQLQNQLKLHKMEEKRNNQMLNSNQFNIKLANTHNRYQQAFVDELPQNFDIKGSKNLKIRQLLMKMKKHQNVINTRKLSNHQNQSIKYNQGTVYQSIFDLNQRKLSKELRYNNQSFDHNLYSTQIFYKERQKKQYRGKSPTKVSPNKNNVKLKKIINDQGTIKGTKLA